MINFHYPLALVEPLLEVPFLPTLRPVLSVASWSAPCSLSISLCLSCSRSSISFSSWWYIAKFRTWRAASTSDFKTCPSQVTRHFSSIIKQGSNIITMLRGEYYIVINKLVIYSFSVLLISQWRLCTSLISQMDYFNNNLLSPITLLCYFQMDNEPKITITCLLSLSLAWAVDRRIIVSNVLAVIGSVPPPV